MNNVQLLDEIRTKECPNCGKEPCEPCFKCKFDMWDDTLGEVCVFDFRRDPTMLTQPKQELINNLERTIKDLNKTWREN